MITNSRITIQRPKPADERRLPEEFGTSIRVMKQTASGQTGRKKYSGTICGRLQQSNLPIMCESHDNFQQGLYRHRGRVRSLGRISTLLPSAAPGLAVSGNCASSGLVVRVRPALDGAARGVAERSH